VHWHEIQQIRAKVKVYTGHLGEATVEHVVHHLPLILRHDLSFACSRTPGAFIDPELIASIFRDSIRAFDDSIAADVINLFPGGKEKGLKVLDEIDDDEVRRIVNDYDDGLVAYAKAKLCMYGTTALIALVDERQENLWVANLGDCQAGEY
jgi:pyruvate dehydrogenase phosphatase